MAKNGLPMLVDANHGGENKYDTVACIKWIVDRELEKVYSSQPGADGEYVDPEQELGILRKHQARKAKVEADLAERVVLDAELVQLEMGRMDSEVRTAMLALPARIAPTIVKLRSVRDIRLALKADVLTTLETLSGSNDSDDCESPPGET